MVKNGDVKIGDVVKIYVMVKIGNVVVGLSW